MERVVNIIVDTNDTLANKEDRLLDVYENICNPDVPPAYTELVSGSDTSMISHEETEHLNHTQEGIRITQGSKILLYYVNTYSMVKSTTSTVLIPN